MPDYATVDLVKDYIGIDDDADDAFIALWITTVSRNVDDHCGRQFGQVDGAEDRYYPTFYDRNELAWYAEIDDVQDADGLTFASESGAVVDPAGYKLLPRNAMAKGQPYTKARLTSWRGGELTGNGLWGWDAVPAGVTAGLLLQANRLNARRKSPFGISGSPSEQGELRLLAKLDPDFEVALKPYVRKWWAR